MKSSRNISLILWCFPWRHSRYYMYMECNTYTTCLHFVYRYKQICYNDCARKEFSANCACRALTDMARECTQRNRDRDLSWRTDTLCRKLLMGTVLVHKGGG